MMAFTRRRLPHLSIVGRPVFVTFRLEGSLPQSRGFPRNSMTSIAAFKTMDLLLDENRESPRCLAQTDIASLVRRSLQDVEAEGVNLHCWVIMPNHVHLLLTRSSDLPSLLQKLKGSTARMANQILERKGTFWQSESYDYVVRNAQEFSAIERYILENPVRAGLVDRLDDYPWLGWSRTTPGLKSRAD